MTATGEDEPKNAVAQSMGDTSDDRSITRRNLLRAGLTLGIVSMVAGVASVAKSLLSPTNPPSPSGGQSTTVTRTLTTTITQGGGGNQTSIASSSTSTESTSTSSSPFPRLMIANVSDLAVSKPVSFNYPLEETPNILVKLGVKATGGVGPDGDIVAYSVICQHLGCVTAFLPSGTGPACDASYKASGPEGYCCCHGTVYDLVNSAAVLDGPSPRPLPQVILSVDSSGDIYAVGMTPPSIFGHSTGSNDVLNDLKGGTLVSG